MIGEPGDTLVDEVPLQGVLTRLFRRCHQGLAENRCVGEGYVFEQGGTIVVLRRLYHRFPSLIVPMKAQVHRVFPTRRPGQGASVLH